MNADQVSIIRATIAEIEGIDVHELLKNQFHVSIETMVWFDIRATELPHLISRMVEQMKAGMQGNDAVLYPALFPCEMPNQNFGNRDVCQLFREFAHNLRNHNWQVVTALLKGIISYQMHTGFWHGGSKGVANLARFQRIAKFKELDERSAELGKKTLEAQKLIDESAENIGKAKKDAAMINHYLIAAADASKNCHEEYIKSSTTHARLEELLQIAQKLLNQTDTNLKINSDNLEKVRETMLAASQTSNELQSKYEWIKGQEAVVKEVSGNAAAGVLGKNFATRKDELEKSVRLWLGGVFISIVLSALWIGYAHKYLQKEGTDIWQVLVINLGLLAPVFLLAGWTIRQYARERQYQEEYAFRATVAMTLSAFADRLDGVSDSRTELIRQTVERLYQMPLDLTFRHNNFPIFRTKAVQELVKDITEMVKEVRGGK